MDQCLSTSETSGLYAALVVSIVVSWAPGALAEIKDKKGLTIRPFSGALFAAVAAVFIFDLYVLATCEVAFGQVSSEFFTILPFAVMNLAFCWFSASVPKVFRLDKIGFYVSLGNKSVVKEFLTFCAFLGTIAVIMNDHTLSARVFFLSIFTFLVALMMASYADSTRGKETGN